MTGQIHIFLIISSNRIDLLSMKQYQFTNNVKQHFESKYQIYTKLNSHENRVVASLVKNPDEEQIFFKVANTERSMVTTINFEISRERNYCHQEIIHSEILSGSLICCVRIIQRKCCIHECWSLRHDDKEKSASNLTQQLIPSSSIAMNENRDCQSRAQLFLPKLIKSL